MKDNKRECKIVQELLPNYIEKLTSEEVNEYIERHLSKCIECKQKLENMQKTIDIEKINDKEIDYLKTIKRKNNRKIKITILISIFTVILLAILMFIFFGNYTISKNEYGTYEIKALKEDTSKILNYEIMILKEKNTGGKPLTITWYVIIDAKKQKCVNIIQEFDGYNEEELQEQYKEYKEHWNEWYSPRIENGRIYISVDIYNGKSKEEIKQIFERQYEILSITNI